MVKYLLGALVLSRIFALASAQNGYEGYKLDRQGDQTSAIYETADTPSVNNSAVWADPDVYLNASVHVGEIFLEVDNITAKVNLDAQVLKLLHFNAGVNAHIDRVRLKIEKVEAKVLLEARLGNLVLMIGDVLSSLDLNPIIATLGSDLGKIVNTTVGALGGALGPPKGGGGAQGGQQAGAGAQGGTQAQGQAPQTQAPSLQARSFKMEHNILYSVNDYSGHTHTNRVLAQNGNIVDQYLDNNGNHYGENIMGYYTTDMTFNQNNRTTSWNNEVVHEVEYVYAPFPGLSVVSAIFINLAGNVVGTAVISEAFGGGSSTVD
jgi:hypothetical protein